MRIKQAKGKIRQPKKCLDRGGGEVAWRFEERRANHAMLLAPPPHHPQQWSPNALGIPLRASSVLPAQRT